MEKSEEWGKRQNKKQELLDRIKELEAEQLNSQQVAQIEVKETKKWPWLKVRK